MAKKITLPPEAEEARNLFIEVKRLRSEGRAEALRALEQKLEQKSNYLKSLVARLLAQGVPIHAIIRATGMSRQTVTNYKKDYLEMMGADSLDGLFTFTEAEDGVSLPEGVGWSVMNGRVRITVAGKFVGELEDGRWYDDAVGITVPEVPEWVAEVGRLVESGEVGR